MSWEGSCVGVLGLFTLLVLLTLLDLTGHIAQQVYLSERYESVTREPLQKGCDSHVLPIHSLVHFLLASAQC
jgi:hypothetical protein